MHWWQWIKCGFCVLVASLLFGWVISGAYGQTVAAWAQAIGTVAAIGGAAWVAQGQMRQAQASDKAETRAFVDAVYAELQVMFEIFNIDVLTGLSNWPDGHKLLLPHPIRQMVFVIYPASAARVGKINDEALRKLIISTYDKAAQILHAMSILHTLTVEREATSDVPANDTKWLNRFRAVENDMRGFTQFLRVEGERLAENMTVLRNSIDEWKARQNRESDARL